MTATVFQCDFPFSGPWGAGMAEAMEGLARDIAAEEGLVWKLWTENEATGRAGGIYLFRSAEQAAAYAEKHIARLGQFGIEGIVAHHFAVNDGLSAITHGARAGL